MNKFCKGCHDINYHIVTFAFFCCRYGIISEEGLSSPTTICSSSRRQRHIYTSDSNKIKIQLLHDRLKEDETNFIIQYKGMFHCISRLTLKIVQRNYLIQKESFLPCVSVVVQRNVLSGCLVTHNLTKVCLLQHHLSLWEEVLETNKAAILRLKFWQLFIIKGTVRLIHCYVEIPREPKNKLAVFLQLPLIP